MRKNSKSKRVETGVSQYFAKRGPTTTAIQQVLANDVKNMSKTPHN